MKIRKATWTQFFLVQVAHVNRDTFSGDSSPPFSCEFLFGALSEIKPCDTQHSACAWSYNEDHGHLNKTCANVKGISFNSLIKTDDNKICEKSHSTIDNVSNVLTTCYCFTDKCNADTQIFSKNHSKIDRNPCKISLANKAINVKLFLCFTYILTSSTLLALLNIQLYWESNVCSFYLVEPTVFIITKWFFAKIVFSSVKYFSRCKCQILIGNMSFFSMKM